MLQAIADYRSILQEIVDTESELVNLRIEVVRPQLAKVRRRLYYGFTLKHQSC